jgi:lipid-A-disaccharide synthase-like uncharacterized protein
MSHFLSLYAAASFFEQFKNPAELAWVIFGFTGQVVFGMRFFVQWIHSERHGESKVPEAFWWLSIVGSLINLIYFIHRRDPVGMLGYILNLIPYVRNLMLIYKKKAQLRAEGRGFEVMPPDQPR